MRCKSLNLKLQWAASRTLPSSRPSEAGQSGWSSFCSQATKVAKGKGNASLRSWGAHGKEKERIRVLLNKVAKSAICAVRASHDKALTACFGLHFKAGRSSSCEDWHTCKKSAS